MQRFDTKSSDPLGYTLITYPQLVCGKSGANTYHAHVGAQSWHPTKIDHVHKCTDHCEHVGRVHVPTQALQHCTAAQLVTAIMLKAGHVPIILTPLTLKSDTELWHFMAWVTLSA